VLALPFERTEAILEGMVAAFEFFGAVPREVWWDNPKTVAALILLGRERRCQPRYAALASHYAFEPRFCMPARGNEKPDAEGTVKAVQSNRPAEYIRLNSRGRRAACFARLSVPDRTPGHPVPLGPSSARLPATSLVTSAVTPTDPRLLPPLLSSTDLATTLRSAERGAC
jgi:hypothetical protein